MAGWLGAIVRFIISAIVLLVLGYLLPGFTMVGFWNALLAAVVIAVLGFIVEAVFGDAISPQRRGFVGFVISALVIYFSQFLIQGFQVSALGAILGALAIGIIDAFVPTELR